MNKITVTGRLTNEPTTKKTSTGKDVTRFSLAVPRKFQRNVVDFIPVVAWEQAARYSGSFWHKGQKVIVTGELHIES